MKRKPGTRCRTRWIAVGQKRGALAPCPLEHVGQNEHRHVASHTIALTGDLHQLADHRFLRGGIRVVELQGVGPSGEIRIAAIGEKKISCLAFHPGVIKRCAGKIQFRAGDEILGMFLHPRMIQPHVIRDKIEHQSQPAVAKPGTKASEGGIAPETLVNLIASDRETRAGDVLLAQVRQGLPKFAAPLGIRTRDSLRSPGRSARR